MRLRAAAGQRGGLGRGRGTAPTGVGVVYAVGVSVGWAGKGTRRGRWKGLDSGVKFVGTRRGAGPVIGMRPMQMESGTELLDCWVA